MLLPSLRHAFLLERRPGSFAKLVNDLMDGSLTATRDILALHDTRPNLAQAILHQGLGTFTEPLIRFVLACAGIDPEGKPEPKKTKGKSVPFADHLANLYRLGTGWLGWTPAETLDATPAEITSAYEGRLDMLKAIFGGEDKPEPDADVPLDDKVRTALGSFGTTIVKRRKTS